MPSRPTTTRTRSAPASTTSTRLASPTVDEIAELILEAARPFRATQLWVDPDCGLETRAWAEVEPAIGNLVAAAVVARTRIEGGLTHTAA